MTCAWYAVLSYLQKTTDDKPFAFCSILYFGFWNIVFLYFVLWVVRASNAVSSRPRNLTCQGLLQQGYSTATSFITYFVFCNLCSVCCFYPFILCILAIAFLSISYERPLNTPKSNKRPWRSPEDKRLFTKMVSKQFFQKTFPTESLRRICRLYVYGLGYNPFVGDSKVMILLW